MNYKFEQVDKRSQELREDMNSRFEQMMSFMSMLVVIFSSNPANP